MSHQLTIRPFQPEDQDAAKTLILEGLVEHWGFLDPTKNPDLDDIGTAYQHGTFLVACLGPQIVGTGAFIPHSPDTVEIVRMSVARTARRQGLGRQVLASLCQHAAASGFTRVILETTETWDAVIAFYLDFGFEITHYLDGDVYFAIQLPLKNTGDQ